ncbi:MAG TPA: chemotaxis protein CheB [Nevskiaceae bacterium]|nr:chemotaxis protein CheB [Nevskiaceae bacterium]
MVGASSGGVEALCQVLAGLPADFPAPILIVQHTRSESARGLCEAFIHAGRLPVVEAEPRQPILPGCVYVAPPDYHLLVEQGPRIALSVDERVCHVRPSVDVLFESAADVWKDRLAGVILTGANGDGARGLAAVRSRRGVAIVQDPDDAQMREMPETALRACGADHVVPLAGVASLLSEMCRRPARRSGGSRGPRTPEERG